MWLSQELLLCTTEICLNRGRNKADKSFPTFYVFRLKQQKLQITEAFT